MARQVMKWVGVRSLWILVLSVGAMVAVSEAEEEKTAVSKFEATLTVQETKQEKAGREFAQTLFSIETGTAKYRMIYKSFPGEGAADNPTLLNDSASGYGMMEPNTFWYWNGFLNAFLYGVPHSMSKIQGKVKVLENGGQRVAYDLVFDSQEGVIVVRTVALAGRNELFVSVYGKSLAVVDEWKLATEFRCYPLGAEGPFDRWVHTDGPAIQNAGTEDKVFPLNLDSAPWLLFTDHALNPDGKSEGQLGLVFDKNGLESAGVRHQNNYGILPQFISKPGITMQRFVVCNFGSMTWQAACGILAGLAQESGVILDKAFQGLPSVF